VVKVLNASLGGRIIFQRALKERIHDTKSMGHDVCHGRRVFIWDALKLTPHRLAAPIIEAMVCADNGIFVKALDKIESQLLLLRRKIGEGPNGLG